MVTDIIRTIGSIGPDAREALPLLEEVARDPVFIGSKTPELREPAIAAIAKITGTDAKKSAEPKEPSKKTGEKPKTSPPKGELKSGQLTYDGKTFDEWLAFVDTERKPDRLIEAMAALETLGTGDQAAATAKRIFELMRTHGTNRTRFARDRSAEPSAKQSTGSLQMAAVRAVRKMPAPIVAERLTDELKQGNLNSREFCLSVLDRRVLGRMGVRSGGEVLQ